MNRHPTGDWLRHGGNYFDVRVINETWSKGWNVRYWPPQSTPATTNACAGNRLASWPSGSARIRSVVSARDRLPMG